MIENYTKFCPLCKKTQIYPNKYKFKFSVDHNILCQSCCKIGKHPSEETRKKLSLAHKGNNYHLGKFHSKESKIKMSISKQGEKHPMFGKRGKDSPFFGKKKSVEFKEKVSQSLRGIPHTDEHKRKIRLSTINLIQKNKLNGGQLFPRYNSAACKYFDNLNKNNGWNLQHALNGGEFYIKELGYWVDGYDKDKNIVVEYDEKHHYKLSHSKKDLIRQNQIINHLCPNEFWRYNEIENKLIKIL